MSVQELTRSEALRACTYMMGYMPHKTPIMIINIISALSISVSSTSTADTKQKGNVLPKQQQSLQTHCNAQTWAVGKSMTWVTVCVVCFHTNMETADTTTGRTKAKLIKQPALANLQIMGRGVGGSYCVCDMNLHTTEAKAVTLKSLIYKTKTKLPKSPNGWMMMAES